MTVGPVQIYVLACLLALSAATQIDQDTASSQNTSARSTAVVRSCVLYHERGTELCASNDGGLTTFNLTASATGYKALQHYYSSFRDVWTWSCVVKDVWWMSVYDISSLVLLGWCLCVSGHDGLWVYLWIAETTAQTSWYKGLTAYSKGKKETPEPEVPIIGDISVARRKGWLQVKKFLFIDILQQSLITFATLIRVFTVDFETVENLHHLLPPQSISGQLYSKLFDSRRPRYWTALIVATSVFLAVWFTGIRLILPMLGGVINPEDENSFTRVGARKEQIKAYKKRLEDNVSALILSMLAVGVAAEVRHFLSQVAWHFIYYQEADYTAVAGLISLTFIVDVPAYATAIVNIAVAIGAGVALVKLVEEYTLAEVNRTKDESMLDNAIEITSSTDKMALPSWKAVLWSILNKDERCKLTKVNLPCTMILSTAILRPGMAGAYLAISAIVIACFYSLQGLSGVIICILACTGIVVVYVQWDEWFAKKSAGSQSVVSDPGSSLSGRSTQV